MEEIKKQLYVLIDEVYSVQEAVRFEDEGDEFIGYIDAIASFKDEPGKPYVIDFKTASRAYKEDAIEKSKQLPIYCEYKGNYNASYIVIEKKLRKKEPRVRIQVLKGQILSKDTESVFKEITDTLNSIKQESFEKNWDSCFSYGKPCPFYNYCRTGDTLNLIKKK